MHSALVLSPQSCSPSPPALLCDQAWEPRPEGEDPGRGSCSCTGKRASWVSRGGGRRRLGEVGRRCRARAGASLGLPLLRSASADTKGPLSWLQPVGKASGRCFLCDSWSRLQGKQTMRGSVAVLHLPLSATPRNRAGETLRICPQPAGTAAARAGFASSRAIGGHCHPARGGQRRRAL